MENRIDQIRQAMKYYFNPALALDEPAETFHSPDGTYSLEVSFYRMEDPERNWNVARGIVRRTADNHVLFDLLRSHDSAWHWWITQQNRNYLVWGEALEGYSIIDLDNEQLAGYSSEEDPFIWTEVFPSEDKTLLAVVGCYWGS